MNKGIFQTKLRTGDEVIVISGKDLGKKGTLREILKSKNKGIVTGINMVKNIPNQTLRWELLVELLNKKLLYLCQI